MVELVRKANQVSTDAGVRSGGVVATVILTLMSVQAHRAEIPHSVMNQPHPMPVLRSRCYSLIQVLASLENRSARTRSDVLAGQALKAALA